VVIQLLFLIYSFFEIEHQYTVWKNCGKKRRQLILIDFSLWPDVSGSVHHNTIHKEKSNKMQKCTKILLFRIYMQLNMFRATRFQALHAVPENV